MIELTRHINRIKGLLFGQGITGYKPMRRDRRASPRGHRSLSCPV
jgi:transposase